MLTRSAAGSSCPQVTHSFPSWRFIFRLKWNVWWLCSASLLWAQASLCGFSLLSIVQKTKRWLSRTICFSGFLCLLWNNCVILRNYLVTKTMYNSSFYTLASAWLMALNLVCVLKSPWSGAAHLPLPCLFFYPTNECCRLSVLGFPRQNCTLPSSWFPPSAVALPFVFPSSFSSSALSLLPLLLCCLLLLPALLPSGWRVGMVCNDSLLSAGFQIDTPDTLGRTCLHAAAAGGWGSERSALCIVFLKIRALTSVVCTMGLVWRN